MAAFLQKESGVKAPQSKFGLFNDPTTKGKTMANRTLLPVTFMLALAIVSLSGFSNAEYQEKQKKEPSFNGKTVSQWVEILKSSKSDRERQNAAIALAKIGPAAKDAVPALIRALNDKNNRLRVAALSGLGAIGPAAKDAVPALILKLKDNDARIRRGAAFALGAIGPGAKAAVPALIGTLKDDFNLVRLGAASGLGRIGPAAKAAVPALIGALKDRFYLVRVDAASALGRIGPAAKNAVPALRAISQNDPSSLVRKTAATALKTIQGKK